ncbi:hypothetical protein [Salinimicrobium xinjiangense]|uniref:hypothetical protein n=1 Tax=Salinimicrobium xinjiangense TaxID=438596 RepID=UPI000490454C|nr:hypothetical protein [Salinimicrobium xinjiangense]
MMIKQNPFSIYDFLGYFIPGALVIYIFLIIFNPSNTEDFVTFLGSNKILDFDNILFFVIISYSLGHLINFSSSITIERYANWKYSFPSKYLMNLNPNHKYWIGPIKIKLWKGFLALIILPVAILDYILGEFFSFKEFYTKKADKFIVEMVKSKGLVLLEKLGAPVTESLREYDFHRIFSHYVYENSKNHQSKMTNYVTLYGFLRSLCLISVLFFWFLLYKIIEGFGASNYDIKIMLTSILFLTITSYLFFMAFMKFYRRYTLEALMLIVIDPDLKENSKS